MEIEIVGPHESERPRLARLSRGALGRFKNGVERVLIRVAHLPNRKEGRLLLRARDGVDVLLIESHERLDQLVVALLRRAGRWLSRRKLSTSTR
jgi:hypothetical protein